MVDEKNKKRNRFWVLGLFFVLTAVFLYPIFLGKVFFPGDLLYQYPPWSLSSPAVLKEVLPINNPLLGDAVTAFYPWYTFMHAAFSQGFFPLWNPLVMTGSPFLANWQSGALAIENLFFYVLKTPVALNIHVFLKLFLALSFTYLFLRKLKLSREASIFGAITYSFSAFFILWLNWPQTRVAIWLPLILFTTEHLIEKPDLRRMAFVALVLAGAILAGHPGTLLQVMIIVFTFGLFRIFVSTDGQFLGKLSKERLLFFAGSLALGFGLGAVLILPGYEFMQNSYQFTQRESTNYLDVSLLPTNMVLLFFYKFYGHLKDGLYIGRSNFNEISSYVGLLPLFFSFFALTYINKLKQIWPFLGLALFSTIVVFGFWLQSFLYSLPTISMQPTQRYIFMLTFCVSVIGAFGFESFLKNKRSNWRIVALTAAYIVTLLLLYIKMNPVIWAMYKNLFYLMLLPFIALCASYFRKQAITSYIFIAILVIDLFLFGISLNSYTKADLVYKNDAVTKYLQKDKTVHRVLPLVDAMMPNSLMPYGITDLRGRDALIIGSSVEFSNLTKDRLSAPQLPNFILPNKVDSALIDFLNVKYVVSEVPIGNTLPRRTIASNGFVELYDKSSQMQTFIAEENKLAGVGLLVGNFKIVINPTFINFRLIDSKGRVIRSSRVKVSYFRDNTYYSINFKPIPDSKGRKYTMLIEAPDVPRKYHTALYISNYDQYGQGFHTDAGRRRDGDLVFYLQYYKPVSKYKQVFKYKNLKLYENTEMLPRVYTVKKAIIIKDQKKTLNYLAKSRLDFKTEVILNKKPVYSGKISSYKGEDQVQMQDYDPNNLKIKLKSNKKQLVVMSDSYYPGWKAYIDGKEAPIYLANSSFRAVAINKGTHTLNLAYQPTSFRNGLAISLMSLALVLGFITYPAIRSKKSA